jgi:TetR/AcrR family transcriptional regulator, cholesterol catabolism regulator
MSSKPPGSSRRVHSKSIERRQRILDAAARALAEHGYSAAKLADIAQEAGTHAGSLYYYFPSREDLMKEVLLTSLDRMSEYSDTLEADAHLSPLDRVLAFVRLVIDQTVQPDDHYLRAYMRNGSQVPEDIRKVLQTRRQRMRRTLTRLLSEAQAANQIPIHVDANVAALFIIGATSWVGMWYQPSGPYSVARIADTFVDLVLHGVVGAKGSVTASQLNNATARKRKTVRGR